MILPVASHSRLTDEQWVLIGPFLPKLTRRQDGRGRPWRENRAVLNGILWILRTGAPWADLPNRYPSYQTCHRRFQQWVRCGVLKDILSVLAEGLHDEGYLDLREAFIDGSFAPAKKGGAGVGTTKRGKGSKIMAIADRHRRPVAIYTNSATPHEVTLVEATLAHRLVQKTPERLIGDNAYESDQLDAGLAQRGLELIAPSPPEPHAPDAGWSAAPPVSTPMEDGTVVCVATELSTDRRAVRTLPGEFPGHVAPCLLADLAAGVYEMTSSFPL